MVNDEEKKTLELFGYIFLVYLVIYIFTSIFKLFRLDVDVIEYLFDTAHSSLMIIGLFLLVVILIYEIAFFVLGYQSAKILKKHGKTKIAPIFWLLTLFVPALSIIPALILWIKNNRLLREKRPPLQASTTTGQGGTPPG